MISQPRIAVLGLSQPYAIYRTCLLITSSSCTRVRTYLRFKLRFKPSAYLYLRTSSKTKDRHLGLLQSLLSSKLVFFHFVCPEALSVSITTRGAKRLRTLCLYQEVSSCLVSRVTLRSSTCVSSIEYLAKSHVFRYITHLPKSGVRS